MKTLLACFLLLSAISCAAEINSGATGPITIGNGLSLTTGTLTASIVTIVPGTNITTSTNGTAVTVTGTTTVSIGITIDGGGSAISTGIKGYISIPYTCTINSVTMLADQSGSAVVDIWRDTYANYPPTVADSITASAQPTITSATKSTDSTLTGWSTTVNGVAGTTITAGDVLGFNVNSATTITRLTLILKVTK